MENGQLSIFNWVVMKHWTDTLRSPAAWLCFAGVACFGLVADLWSKAAAVDAPMPTATWVASAGVWYRCVTVDTMTQPIWPGSIPDRSSSRA